MKHIKDLIKEHYDASTQEKFLSLIEDKIIQALKNSENCVIINKNYIELYNYIDKSFDKMISILYGLGITLEKIYDQYFYWQDANNWLNNDKFHTNLPNINYYFKLSWQFYS